MPNGRPFAQVDVFTEVPLLGNPVAVVLDGTGLTTEEMLAFTAWTNLSEATFVLPATDPGADYAVRIFCPGRELPFAGHPTLGTCHAWLMSGGAPRGDAVVQECGAGLIPIRQTSSGLAFAAPPLRRSGPLDAEDLVEIAACLGIPSSAIVDHHWCDNGPNWQAVMLARAQDVLDLTPDPALLNGRDIGVIGPHPAGTDVDFEVRAFFPGNQGLTEDPVTGSLNAALAQWLLSTGRAPSTFRTAQGTALGRRGRVTIEHIDADIWVGGACRTVVRGTVDLHAANP